MKAENIITVKRAYLAPVIEKVVLDNEISLALASTGNFPFGAPNELSSTKIPEYFNHDPFKNNLV